MKYKSLTLSFALSLTLSLLLPGCGKKEEPAEKTGTLKPDSSVSKTLVLQNPNQSFTLSYKLEKGKNFKYRLTTQQNESVQLQTNDTTVQNNIIQRIIYSISFSVDRIDKNNAAELTCNFTSVKLDADANGKKFKYESGQTKNNEELKPYSQYESITNNPFGIRISKSGDIIEVFRFEQIINKFISINGLQDSINSKQKENLRLSLTEATIKPLLSQIFRKFPEKQVAKDSSWSIPQEAIPLASLVMKSTSIFKITSLEKSNADTVAVIEGDMKTEVTGNQAATDRGIQYYFDKPRVSGSGKIYFNLSDGRVQSSKTSTSMINSFSAQANSPQGLVKETQRKSSDNTIIVEAL
ncbi:MAG: DUF6263 family protein [Ignavibacteria bacterium]